MLGGSTGHVSASQKFGLLGSEFVLRNDALLLQLGQRRAGSTVLGDG